MRNGCCVIGLPWGRVVHVLMFDMAPFYHDLGQTLCEVFVTMRLYVALHSKWLKPRQFALVLGKYLATSER